MLLDVITINRIETDKDTFGRNRTVLTTVFCGRNLDGEEFRKLVEKDNEENGGNVDYEDEYGVEYEVTGELIRQYMEVLRSKGEPVEKMLKENGINKNGEPFNVLNQYYEVEIRAIMG